MKFGKKQHTHTHTHTALFSILLLLGIFGSGSEGKGRSLKMKLIAYFLVIAVLVGVVGYFGFTGTQGVFEKFDHIVDDTSKELIALENIKSTSLRMQSEAISFALIQSELEKTKAAAAAAAAAAEETKEFYDAKEEMEKWEAEFEKFAEEDEKELVEKIDVAEERIEDLGEELINLKKEGKSGQVILDKKEELEEAEEEFLEIIDGAIAEELEEFEEQDEIADALAVKTTTLILITSIIAILFSITLGFFVSYRITRPLEELSKTVDEVSKGNFKAEVKKTSSIKEINNLADSLDRIMKTMKVAVMKMREKGPKVKSEPPAETKEKK